MGEDDRNRPMAGIRILDLTQMVAGPFGTMLMADQGADVIKIERPAAGDPQREFGPYRPDDQVKKIGGGFLRFGRNKRSLALDLSGEAGREIFRELVKRSDVVCENFAPDAMDKLGLGYHSLREINPRIIYAAISGYGHRDIYASPLIDRPAFDLVAQAISGIMDITGQPDGPPTAVGASIGDLLPGIYSMIGVLLALRTREQTGLGQMVDIALFDSLATFAERAAMVYEMTGKSPTRGAELVVAPYDTYQASDGWLVIAAPHQRIWTKFCHAIGRPDLLANPLLATAGDRAKNKETVLRPAIEQWLAVRTKEEASEYLLDRGVPAGPVKNVGEMMESPHMAVRQMVRKMEHPELGSVRVIGNPIKMSGLPEPEVRPAPALGEHSAGVLREVLGYDDARIEALRAAGVVADAHPGVLSVLKAANPSVAGKACDQSQLRSPP